MFHIFKQCNESRHLYLLQLPVSSRFISVTVHNVWNYDGRDRPGLIKVSLVDKVIARVMTSLELIHSIRPVQFSNIHEALQALFHIARPLPRHYRLFFVDQLRLQYLSRNYRL